MDDKIGVSPTFFSWTHTDTDTHTHTPAHTHTFLSMIRGVDFFKNRTDESPLLSDTRQYHPLQMLVVYFQ